MAKSKKDMPESLRPGGMKIEADVPRPWQLDWDKVRSVEQLKFVLRVIVAAQAGDDTIRAADNFMQALTDEDLRTAEGIFVHV